MTERASVRNNTRPRVRYTDGETRTKRIWSCSEDERLRELVSLHGTKNWTKLAAYLAPRTGKQCRERWYNHLAENLKKGNWTQDEDKILIQLQKVYGNQWTKIAKRLPHRTDSSIKNRWHNVMRRGVPAKFETDFDEKLLEEVREELLREKEKGGPKVYRKGTTVSSVYAYAVPTTPTSSAADFITVTEEDGTRNSTSISSTPSSDDADIDISDYSKASHRSEKQMSQKKREIHKISLENDEMTVAQFLATTGSGKACKTDEDA